MEVANRTSGIDRMCFESWKEKSRVERVFSWREMEIAGDVLLLERYGGSQRCLEKGRM